MKVMNHGEYQRKLRHKTPQELQFIIADAGEAANVNPTNANVGFYLDEVLYAAAELRRRNK